MNTTVCKPDSHSYYLREFRFSYAVMYESYIDANYMNEFEKRIMLRLTIFNIFKTRYGIRSMRFFIKKWVKNIFFFIRYVIHHFLYISM